MVVNNGMTLKQRDRIIHEIQKRLVAFFGKYACNIGDDIRADTIKMCIKIRDIGVNPDDVDLDKAAARLVVARYNHYKQFSGEQGIPI